MSSIAKRIKGLTRPKTSNQAASVAVSDSPKRSGSPVDRGAPAALPRAPAAVSVLPLPKPKGAEGGANAQMRPAVRSSFARLRHFLVALSFLLFVVAPSAVSGVYLWTVAVDQYASSVGFAVRREDAGSPTDVLSGLTNFSGSSSTDTDILFEYLQSQKLVSEMDAEIDLRGRWSKPEEDPVFALEKDAPIEALMDYWMRMVRVSYGTGAGLIEIEVRAFEGEDATLIAQTVFAKSAQMINDLSAVARADGIRYSRDELTAAEDRLRTARKNLTTFRNVNQIVDPELDLRSQAGLLGKLHEQQAAALIELDMLGMTTRENDPRVEQAQRRLEVIDRRISQERLTLGGSVGTSSQNDQGFASIIGAYEQLVTDREFAREAYIAARASYDSALSEARRKSRYLAAYLEPTTAQSAVYPERFTLQIVITLFLFLLWSVVVLVYYSVKDRR